MRILFVKHFLNFFIYGSVIMLSITSYFAQEPIPDSTRNFSEYSVNIHGKHIFSYFLKLGPFTPEDRAEFTMQKIQNILNTQGWKPEQIRIENNEIGLDIIYGNEILITLTHQDLEYWNQLNQTNYTLEDYAFYIISSLNKKLTMDSNFWSIKIILVKILLTILTTLITILIFIFISIILKKQWKKVPIISFRHLLKKKLIRNFIFSGIRYTKLFIYIIILFIYLYILFNLIWETTGFFSLIRDNIYNIILIIKKNLLSFPSFLLRIIGLIIFTYLSIYIVRFLFQLLKQKIKTIYKYPNSTLLIYYTIKIAIIIFSILIFISFLPEYYSSILKEIFLLIGILLCIGGVPALVNIISGITLEYIPILRVGDWVQIENTIGKINKKGFLTTQLITFQQEKIEIPNYRILFHRIINYSKQEFFPISIQFPFHYQIPAEKIQNLLIQATSRIKGIQKESIYVLQTDFRTPYIYYELHAHTNQFHKIPQLYSELYRNVQIIFNQNPSIQGKIT